MAPDPPEETAPVPPPAESGYRRLFEDNIAATYRSDFAGRALDCNEACVQLLGCRTKQEVLSRPVSAWYLHPEERQLLMTTLLTQGQVANLELQLQRADGRLIWIVATVTVGSDAQQRPLYYEGTFVDITHRHQADEALAHERHLLALLMDSFPESIFFKDRESRFVRINQACARKLGLADAAAAIGRTDFDFFGAAHAQAAWEDEQEIIRTGRPLLDKQEAELFPDGRTAWGLTSKLPIVDERGEISGTFGISRDITSQKQLEDRLRHTQKMEAVGRLAGGVAHDFNNLLTVITGRSELLQAGLPAGDPRRRHADEILQAAQRAAALTRQLLTFSRQEAVRLQAVDLNACIEGMIPLLKRLAGDGVDLDFALTPGLPLIQADAGQLEQILLNLTVNARDAMPGGGRLRFETAAVTAEGGFGPQDFRIPAGSFVRLQVQDTGCGMDAATQARIFEPFFTTKAVGAGTGLGLATVYGIVKSYAGHVLVESAPEQGATFSLYFPPATAPEVDGGRAGLAGRSVALVLPDPEARQTTREMLEMLGLMVFQAEPQAGVLCFPAPDPGQLDVLLLDASPEAFAGDRSLQFLKQRWPALKLIFLAPTSGPPPLPPGYQAAEVRVLRKPFRYQELREVLETLL